MFASVLASFDLFSRLDHSTLHFRTSCLAEPVTLAYDANRSQVVKRTLILTVLLLTGCGPKLTPVSEVSVGSSGVEIREAEVPSTNEADWPSWRGADGSGIASDQPLPTNWSDTENVVWKASVPGRGHSSPIIVGDKVLLATADERAQEHSVVAFNRSDGTQLWQTTVSTGGFPNQRQMHQKSTHANGTLACDGQRIFCAFLANDEITAFALELSGKEVWKQSVCTFNSKFGYAPSPVVYKSTVIFAADNRGGGCIAALDRESGKIAWRKSRPAVSTYSSPIIANVSGRNQLVISGGDQLVSYDPNTGDEIWSCDGIAEATCGTAVWDDKHVFASGGYPSSETICVLADGSGKRVWSNSTRAYEPSMIIHEGSLYAITDKGIAHCFDAATGDERWKQRLGGGFSASPVICNGLIYVTDDRGKTHVIKASSETCEVVATNQLGSDCYSSLAISNDQMFIRVGQDGGSGRQELLYCLGQVEVAE